MGTVYIIGLGPGNEEYMMPVARKKIEQVKHIIGAKRMLQAVHREDGTVMGNIQDTIAFLEEKEKEGDVAVLVSGDPLMYSLTQSIQKDERSKEWYIQIIPAVGSLQMLGAAFGLTMEEANITSIHGRAVKRGAIAKTIAEHRLNFFLCSKEQGPSYLAQICFDYALEDVHFYIGANLTYEEELLEEGIPEEIIGKDYPSLCVVAIENENTKKVKKQGYVSDDAFIRNRTPMTKEEVRLLAIHNLNLEEDSIVWDLGAGTGSISIECARQCAFGEIYAVEYQKDAIEVIEKNKEKFDCMNLHIIEGKALQVIAQLPTPDCVFIGGTKGELKEILEEIRSRKQGIRVVIAAVTMETLSEAVALLNDWNDVSMLQIQINKSKELGQYHILQPQNPVTLLMAQS